MRRSPLAAATVWLVVCAVCTVLVPPGSALAESGDRPPSEWPQSQWTDATANDELAVASRVMAGDAQEADPSPGIALRDLRRALPELSGDERIEADRLLARPTDRADDPLGDGYTVKSVKKCSRNICLHWVKSTTDKPPSMKWVNYNLKVLTRVWRLEVDKLGYPAPMKDGKRGGNNKFDFYLKDLNPKGYFGYCTNERRTKLGPNIQTAYCVLDNDFTGYSSPPRESLRVTAAHEFFHAIQFALDTYEDTWLMESTATWMEERFADDVNDNRLFIPEGQVANPEQSLDLVDPATNNHYGNWPFFEFLSTRWGNDVVRKVWLRASERKGAPKMYSTEAIRSALRTEGQSLPEVFTKYAAGNTAPGKAYPEGAAWPSATIAGTYTLSNASPATGSVPLRINHLASQNVRLIPDATLTNKKWKVRIRVDGPNRASGPGAYLLLRQPGGKLFGKAIRLNKKGNGSITVTFSTKTVANLTVTMANTSTRMKCWQTTTFACQGIAKHDNSGFTLTAKAFRP